MDEIKNIKLPKALLEELRKAEQASAFSWESRNEGVHERVNFDDTIWGLSLAGGAFYKTPLRVTQVKEGSRAEHAGIKVGDYLRCINDIDTSTLTIQEAHDIILKSGLEIKFALSAPDIEETVHNVYQDHFEEEEEERGRLQAQELQHEELIFKGAKIVKEGSRAEHAGIKVGDYLRCINDIDTSTLTIQEAHDIILKSGLEIKFALSAPDIEETVHNVYQDHFEEEEEERGRLQAQELQHEELIFKGAKIGQNFNRKQRKRKRQNGDSYD